jgi:bacillithiol system protein YtxJ
MRFFRTASSAPSIPEVRTIEACEKLLEGSLTILFKHSTGCGTSWSAHREIVEFCRLRPEAPVVLLPVLQSRALCRYIADRFAIEHQSPQVLVIRDKQLVSAVSHDEITTQFLLDCTAD